MCSEQQRLRVARRHLPDWLQGNFAPNHMGLAQAWGYLSAMRGQKRVILVLSFLTCFDLLLVKYMKSEFQLQDECKEHVMSSF